jgi:hypothetical protein
MNDAKLVIFHHIPKTAGTTLREILNRQYGEGQVFETNWYPGERLLAERPFGIYTGKKKPGETWYPGLLTEIAYRYEFFQREAASPIRAIYGFHCEYGLAEYIFQPSETFTFLRHPVDRALSHYYFTVDVPEGLDEAGLEAHLLARIEGNLQTKMLSGPHGAGPLPPPEEMLARAKANLKSCAVVGLTERFDETLMLLKQRFGWRWPFYVRKYVNPNRPKKDVLPPAVLQRIAAENELDAALYAYAQELFAQQIQAYGPGLSRTVKLFRLVNSAWGKWQTLRQAVRQGLSHLYHQLSVQGRLAHIIPPGLRPRVRQSIDEGRLNLEVSLGKLTIGEYDFFASRWQFRPPFGLVIAEDNLLPRYDELAAFKIEKAPSVVLLNAKSGQTLLNRKTRQHLNLEEFEPLIWQALVEYGDIGMAQEKLKTQPDADPQAISRSILLLVGKLTQAGFALVMAPSSSVNDRTRDRQP